MVRARGMETREFVHEPGAPADSDSGIAIAISHDQGFQGHSTDLTGDMPKTLICQFNIPRVRKRSARVRPD